MVVFGFLVIVLCLPLACNASVTPIPTPITFTPSGNIAPTGTPPPITSSTETPAPLPPAPPARTQISLQAELDYKTKRLQVQETITYTNHTEQTLNELVLAVDPNRYPDAFHLKELRWADGETVKEHTLENVKLNVPMPAPLLPNAMIGLQLIYELDLPGQSATLGYTARQINLGDWYPFIPPYRAGQGWLIHEPAPVGEYLVYDIADYMVEIKVTNAPSKLIIAASAPAEASGRPWRYHFEAARNFAWSASADYQILSKSAGQAQVTGYVFPEHLAAGRAAVDATADALTFYSSAFGGYPHRSLAVVEAEFADGMEYHGLYFLGQEYYAGYTNNPQNYLTAIAVHETAHQWWYGLVGNDQAAEPWLDESLCVYSERLYYETHYPHLLNWWWEFRVHRFEPSGWVNSTVYDYDQFRPYVNAVYLRGALFLEELRKQMGDQAFLAFLRDYAARGACRQVTSVDFFAALSQHTNLDLSELTARYFNSPIK